MIDLSFDHLFDPVLTGINNALPKLPGALIALLFGILLVKVLAWLVDLSLSLTTLPRGLRGILQSLTHSLLWVFLGITVLQSLGLNNVALAFSGGIAAVGLALAAGGASLASDILAGIFLSRDPDFGVGDKVQAGEGPTEGIVESMDMRRTRIRSEDNKLHVIPNSVIERKEWVLLATRKQLKEATEAKKTG